jgi:hypothetical protein
VIDSGRVAVARLTEVFRQAAESRIVTGAHRINAGQMRWRLPSAPRVIGQSTCTSLTGSRPKRRGMRRVTILTEVFRQAAESRIVTGAHRINAGQMPEGADTPDGGFGFSTRWSAWLRWRLPSAPRVIGQSTCTSLTGSSRIVTGAHRINAGQMPEGADTPDGDFFVVKIDDPAGAPG